MKLRLHFPFVFALILSVLIGCTNHHKADQTAYYQCLDSADTAKNHFDYTKAFKCYNQSLQYCSDTTPNWTAYSQIEMAKIQNQLGDYHGADSILTQTVKLAVDTVYQLNAHVALANSYIERHNYQEAVRVYSQCIPQLHKVADRLVVENNLSYVFLKSKQFTKAFSLLNRLKGHPALDTLFATKAMILDNWGVAVLALQKSGCKAAFDQAYVLRDSLQNMSGLTSSAMHYALYYQQQKQKDSMLYWAQKAYSFAVQCHNPDDRLEALRYAITAASPTVAQSYMAQYLHLSDSLQSSKARAKAQFTSILYDSKKAKQENFQFRKQINGLLILVGVILLLSLGTTYVLRVRARQKELQAVYSTELRLSKQLHDELANEVFTTLSFVENQTPESDTKEIVLDQLDGIYQQTRSLSRAMGAIETGELFKEELLELLASFSTAKVTVVALNVEWIPWHSFSAPIKITVYRVLQELLVNMKKHSGASRVQIHFTMERGQLAVTYEDNGIGLPAPPFSKNGLANVENRIFSLKGSLTFESTNHSGCVIHFRIPK
ncbi:tetratricopeptide repeat-containing sensor histidine kinase [Flavobacterium stagni]|uniref:histidine kinase n=1 Tax=Flavobacterium stagni TaxID=2506421 RepID=A0A4Q1K7S6_9FLAO|nr:ATP-binding protein [Flavobacterium stagni]RXR21619.1 hypothetical protein EQG61_11450 [Flavobacterium stagni]